MTDRPKNARYTRDHEWMIVDGDEATVGITDFAVEHLGDLVFVDLPGVGQTAEAEESIAEVESVKAVAEVKSPAAGEVTSVNEGLADDQTGLTTDPFGAGWIWKMKVEPGAGDDLMDLPAYEGFLTSDDAIPS